MKTLSLQVPVSKVFRSVYLDDDDYERVKLFRWHFAWTPNDKLLPMITIEGHVIRLARFIAGVGPNEKVLHRNGNRRDCQRRNLLFRSRTEDFAPGFSMAPLPARRRPVKRVEIYEPVNFSKLEDYL
jgi:hypothetical protein